MDKHKIYLQGYAQLAKPLIYLAHPVFLLDSVKVLGEQIAEYAEVRVLNPLQDLEQVTSIESAITYTSNLTPDQIVTGDLAAIDKCDAIVAVLFSGVRSIGTLMEIFYAGYTLKRPIFLYTDQMLQNNPWLQFLGCRMFLDKQSLLDGIKLWTKDDWDGNPIGRYSDVSANKNSE